MFGDVHALERIEREAWRQLAAAAPKPFVEAVGMQTRDLKGAFLMMASRIPQFQFNWLAGAGLMATESGEVAAAVEACRAAGQTKFFIQNPPGPHEASVAAAAQACGLAQHPLAWAKFSQPTRQAHVDTKLVIREVGPDDAELFAATAIAGFGMPPPMANWLRPIVGLPGWRAYVSFAGDLPAGAGALFVDGDYAWLGIGATKPEFRKRGSQSALLARRLSDAAQLGARFAVTETGVPQKGQPSPSYNNILAAGFEVAYVRPNWAEAQ